MWNKRFAQAVCTALIVMIFGSAGAVHAAGENQSPSDKAKYSSLSIAWSEPEELPILIRRAAVGPAAAFPVINGDRPRFLCTYKCRITNLLKALSPLRNVHGGMTRLILTS